MQSPYFYQSRPQFLHPFWCSVLLLRPEQAKSSLIWLRFLVKTRYLRQWLKLYSIFMVPKTFPERFHTNPREKSVRGGKVRLLHLCRVGSVRIQTSMAHEETEFFAVPRTKDEAQVILRAAMAARPSQPAHRAREGSPLEHPAPQRSESQGGDMREPEPAAPRRTPLLPVLFDAALHPATHLPCHSHITILCSLTMISISTAFMATRLSTSTVPTPPPSRIADTVSPGY